MHEIHVQFKNSCKKKDKNVFSILKFIQKKTFFCLSQNSSKFMQKKANNFFQIAKINMQKKKSKILFQKTGKKKRCKKAGGV